MTASPVMKLQDQKPVSIFRLYTKINALLSLTPFLLFFPSCCYTAPTAPVSTHSTLPRCTLIFTSPVHCPFLRQVFSLLYLCSLYIPNLFIWFCPLTNYSIIPWYGHKHQTLRPLNNFLRQTAHPHITWQECENTFLPYLNQSGSQTSHSLMWHVDSCCPCSWNTSLLLKLNLNNITEQNITVFNKDLCLDDFMILTKTRCNQIWRHVYKAASYDYISNKNNKKKIQINCIKYCRKCI